MDDGWCWPFTVIFSLIFIVLGVLGHFFGKRENLSPSKVWCVAGVLYFLVMFQMYLIYAHPPPGKQPKMPCWLRVWVDGE